MPRVHKNTARTDRYTYGLKVEDSKTKSGFRTDKSKPRDENDRLFCKKGDTYYWWQFRNGGKIYSLTMPRPSQLTQSEFYQTVYSIQEDIQDATVEDFLEDEGALTMFREEMEGRIEELESQLQDKESNLSCHEGLSQSPVYELITERLEAVSEWLNDMQAIDTNFDFSEIESEVEAEFDDEEAEEMQEEGTYEEELESRIEEAKRTRIEEALEEMQGLEISL